MDFDGIFEAVRNGNVQLMCKFLSDYIAVQKFVNGDPRTFNAVLSSAINTRGYRYCSKNSTEVNEMYDVFILQLIKAAKKVHFGLFDKRTLLMSALENYMSFEIIDELIKAGSDLNATSVDTSMTPLMYALLAKRDKNIITELINLGANVNIRDQIGWTALFYGMRYSHPDVIEVLLNAISNVHDLDNKGRNVLMIHICSGVGSDCDARESVDMFLKYGINDTDLRHIDNDGNSILHNTCCSYLFELALKSGVSLEGKNNKGETPLLKSMYSSYVKKFVYLLKSGANMHHTDQELQTALHLCIPKFRVISPRILDMLIYHGGNMYARNIYNQTPLDIVLENDYILHRGHANVILKHVIFFYDNEIDFVNKVLENVNHSEDVSSFIAECKKELTLMRETFIANGVTFYEFCILKRYYKSKCVNISPNEYKYSCAEICELFPNYESLIIIRIKDNRLQKRKLDLRRRFENISFGAVDTVNTNVHEVLSYDCLYHISRYLNYKEMFNIFSAAIES